MGKTTRITIIKKIQKASIQTTRKLISNKRTFKNWKRWKPRRRVRLKKWRTKEKKWRGVKISLRIWFWRKRRIIERRKRSKNFNKRPKIFLMPKKCSRKRKRFWLKTSRCKRKTWTKCADSIVTGTRLSSRRSSTKRNRRRTHRISKNKKKSAKDRKSRKRLWTNWIIREWRRILWTVLMIETSYRWLTAWCYAKSKWRIHNLRNSIVATQSQLLVIVRWEPHLCLRDKRMRSPMTRVN